MKVLHVSYYDSVTGSGIAAWRLHEALLQSNVDSQMLVMQKCSNSPAVKRASFAARVKSWIDQRAASRILRLQKSSNPFSHSLNFFPNPILHEIRKSKADLVHLHWIGGEMLSIEQVAQIPCPVVWTLHDAWAFCGTEHCLDVLGNMTRFREGYTKENRPPEERGIDLARLVWERKCFYWKDLSIYFITPSEWMGHQLKMSSLLHSCDCSVIPNCLNTELFAPAGRLHLTDTFSGIRKNGRERDQR